MKNDILELDITDVTIEGFGVGRYDNKVYFVENTAKGDKINALVLKELKNHGFAKVVNIIEQSKDRINSDCVISQKCGGCTFRHINYKTELKIKENHIKQAFSRLGNMDITVNDAVFDSWERYRNKVQYPFGRDDLGQCIFGYYANRSHRIIQHKDCPLQDKIFTDIADFCRKTANQMFIRAYNEETAKGILRHIVMRKNRKGEIIVCLVVFSNHKKLETLAKALSDNFPQIIGVHININKRKDNVIFGEEGFCVFGKEHITDTLCGKTFNISPRAFYQVNANMAEKLYDHAKSLISKSNSSRIILDLYCGAGTIGICLADENDKLCGVEIIPEAIENAKQNAKINGRNKDNTLFVCGDASVGVEECNKKFGKPDVIILDPPRKGLEKAVIETVVKANPKEIVYISCDPATLARDCGIFATYGYITKEATPFDLFPRTSHVETVVHLEKVN